MLGSLPCCAIIQKRPNVRYFFTIFGHAFSRTGKKLNECCEYASAICGTSFRSGSCHRLEADQDEKKRLFFLLQAQNLNTSGLHSDIQTTVEAFNAHKALIPCLSGDSALHFEYGSWLGTTTRQMQIHTTEFNHSKYNYVIYYYYVPTSTRIILDEELV